MSSGGTNTTTSTSQPPAQFLNAYQNVQNQAQQVASAPYTPYTGTQVAPLSPDTNTGITGVQNAQGVANPYINSAAQYIGNSTSPLAPGYQPYGNEAQSYYQAAATPISPTQFSAGQIGQYESPYTQQVLQTTMAAENNQDAQQQQQLQGNAASQGAFGGDRQAVAAGILGGQQAIANNATNAGIENQGYTQALGEFNIQQQTGVQAQEASQQLQQVAGQGISGIGSTLLGANEANSWLNSQAGYGMGNLGNEAQSTSLTDANAELGVGSLEQQQAQSQLNVPYEQFLAQQAYPFQTTQFLGNIAEGLGGASGGTSSTTSPAPSTVSQVGGLGLAGLGLYGLLAADGGEIPHRVSGGGILPIDASSGYVPAFSSSVQRSGIPAAPKPASGQTGLAPSLTSTIDTSLPMLKDVFGKEGYRSRHAGDGASDPLAGLDPVGSGLASSAITSDVADGGEIPRRAVGGIVTPFPRLPHMGGRGIAPINDNFSPHHEPLRMRAGGGGLPVSVQMMPGSYAGAPSIPQLTGGGGGGIAGGGTNPAVANYLSSVMAGTASAPAVQAGPAAAAAPPTAPKAPDIIPDNNWSGSQGSSGPMQRGGGIMAFRASGGEAAEDAAAEAAWVASNSPFNDKSDNGRADGGGLDDTIPLPPIPPDQMPDQTPVSVTTSDSSDATPSSGGIASDTHSGGHMGHSNPWMSVLAAGLGIMGGTSPQAGVNIGRGGLEGLQFGQRQGQIDEEAALREAQQEANNQYRIGILNDKGRGRDIQSDRAQTYNQLSQARAAQVQALAALETARAAHAGASHATEGDILGSAVGSLADGKTVDPDTGQPYTKAKALMVIKGTDSLVRRRQDQSDLGYRAADQRDESLDIRRQAYDETVHQHGIQNDANQQKILLGQIKGLSDQGLRVYMSSKDPISGKYQTTPQQAEDIAKKFQDDARGSVPNLAPPPGTTGGPGLADPLGIR